MTPLRRASRLVLVLLAVAGLPDAGLAAERALLLSLPGASGAEIEHLYREGALDAGGFAPFFERGEVGPGLELVDPILPGPAARALVTGWLPGRTGAVAERWRPPGAALEARTDLAAEPLPDRSLWTAAAAAGKHVGTVLWPGLDNSEEARRVDWGVSPTAIEHFPSRSIKLERHRWVDNAYGKGPGPSLYWSLPPTVPSYSTPLTFSVPFMMPHSRHELIYDMVAVDRTDDGVENYDGLLISSDVNPRKGFVGVVQPGNWLRVELPFSSGSRAGSPEVAWVKLIELDPRLEKTWVYVSGTYFSRSHPSALVRRLDAQPVVHPGPPDEKALVAGIAGGYGLDEATFVEQSGRLVAFAVDATLAGMANRPTDLVLAELPVFLPAARRLERFDPRHPEFDAELALRLRSARRELYRSVDRELARLLATIDLERTAVFLVSAYEAQPVHSDVDIGDLLYALPALAPLRRDVTAPAWSVEGEEGVAQIYLAIEGRDPDGVLSPGQAARAAQDIRDALVALRDDGEPVFRQVLLRREARRLGLDHPNTGDIVAFARPGYRVVFGSKNPEVVERTANVDAVGGQLAADRASAGVWLALGSGIRARRLSSLPAVTDVAPRIARTLGFKLPRR